MGFGMSMAERLAVAAGLGLVFALLLRWAL